FPSVYVLPVDFVGVKCLPAHSPLPADNPLALHQLPGRVWPVYHFDRLGTAVRNVPRQDALLQEAPAAAARRVDRRCRFPLHHLITDSTFPLLDPLGRDKPAPIDGRFGNLSLGDEQSVSSCSPLFAFAARSAGPSIYGQFHVLSRDLMASVLLATTLLFHHGDEAHATIRIGGELAPRSLARLRVAMDCFLHHFGQHGHVPSGGRTLNDGPLHRTWRGFSAPRRPAHSARA